MTGITGLRETDAALQPETGRPVAYEGTVIFRIVDSQITERWGTVDLFGILSQLGATLTLST